MKMSEKFIKWIIAGGAFLEVGAIIAFIIAMNDAVYNNNATIGNYFIAGGAFAVMMGFSVLIGWSIKKLEEPKENV